MEGSIQHLDARVPGRRWVNPQSRGLLGWEGRGTGKGEHRPGHPVWGRTPSRHHRSGYLEALIQMESTGDGSRVLCLILMEAEG